LQNVSYWYNAKLQTKLKTAHTIKTSHASPL